MKQFSLPKELRGIGYSLTEKKWVKLSNRGQSDGEKHG